MIASAAGLNTFAVRERKMYLLRTASTEVMVITYHGSCARSTIATIMAVSTAPLGNSQACFLTRRISSIHQARGERRARQPGRDRADPLPGRRHRDQDRQE